MPKGVEHTPAARLAKLQAQVSSSVMPKGVEHMSVRALVYFQCGVEFSDAERR